MWSVGSLSSPKIEPQAKEVKAPSPNHQTAKEFPVGFFITAVWCMQKLRLREGNSSNAKQPELKGRSPFSKARVSGKHFFFRKAFFCMDKEGKDP